MTEEVKESTDETKNETTKSQEGGDENSSGEETEVEQPSNPLGALTSIYPQDLFQANQVNAVAFYVVAKKKIGAEVKNRGIELSGEARQAAQNYLNDYLGGDAENASDGNRVSNERFENTLENSAALAGVIGGATLGKGGDGSAFSKFVTKGLKGLLGGAVGYAGAKALNHFGATDMFTNNTGEFTQQGIYLYVPQSIISAYQAQWDEAELGLAGILGQEGMGLEALGEIGTAAARGAIAGAATVPRAVGIGSADFASTIQATSRMADNPYKEQLFRSMGFRKFSFQYIFSPKNRAEMQQVEQLIKIFKFHMHPDMSPETVFLQYPSEFIIEFLHGQDGNVERNENLPRIGACALTNVKVTYGPDGYFNTMKGTKGKPSEITMELAFTELEVLTGQHIQDGF